MSEPAPAQQEVAGVHPLPGLVDVQRVDPPLHAGRHHLQLALVELDRPDGGDLAGERVVRDRHRLHPGEGHPVGGELHPGDRAGRERDLGPVVTALRDAARSGVETTIDTAVARS